jgi:hypothetical protein
MLRSSRCRPGGTGTTSPFDEGDLLQEQEESASAGRMSCCWSPYMVPVVYLAEQLVVPVDYVIETMGRRTPRVGSPSRSSCDAARRHATNAARVEQRSVARSATTERTARYLARSARRYEGCNSRALCLGASPDPRRPKAGWTESD